MRKKFLELKITTDAIVEALGELTDLGFTAVAVNDVYPHPYAVVSDGQTYIGLHEREPGPARLCFIRPELASYVRALRRQRIALEYSHLADDEFHELGFRDPSGQAVTLVEARTFSRGEGSAPGRSVCGRFVEYSLGTNDLQASAAFWSRLGFETIAAGDSPQPWTRLSGCGAIIGLHEAPGLRLGLCFAAEQLDARLEFLRAKGFDARAGAPVAARNQPAGTVFLRNQLQIFLLDAAET
jgi:catechol 2,3-dioxygenase-like lactoylglutathione lyase family enzyme